MSPGAGEGEPGVSLRLPAVFLPGAVPCEGRIAFYDPEGDSLSGPGGPDTEAGDAEAGQGSNRAPLEADGAGGVAATQLTVVRPHGAGVRRRTVPALSLPLDAALPLLVRARHDPAAHPA
ncbi:ATP-dependent helicase, partial [Streptomyces sp. 15-116A]|nr:ATP-dependent helicase [Streptomyces sp. 15-116A]